MKQSWDTYVTGAYDGNRVVSRMLGSGKIVSYEYCPMWINGIRYGIQLDKPLRSGKTKVYLFEDEFEVEIS